MKKVVSLFLLFIVLVLAGCKKDSGNNTTSDPSGYFYAFDLKGTHYLYNNQTLQTGNNGLYSIGGFVPDNTLTNAGGLVVNFNNGDSATSSRVTGLAGQKIYFNGSAYPQVFLDILIPNGKYESLFTGNDTSYYTNITGVSFLKYDTASGNDIYAVKGTFKTKLYNFLSNNNDTVGDATNGKFNIQCSVDHFGY